MKPLLGTLIVYLDVTTAPVQETVTLRISNSVLYERGNADSLTVSGIGLVEDEQAIVLDSLPDYSTLSYSLGSFAPPPPPVVHYSLPSSGIREGGYSVLLGGSRLDAVTEVYFGTQPSPSFETFAENSMSVVVPPWDGESERVYVRVVTPWSEAFASGIFEYDCDNSDGDFLCPELDNCPLIYNPDQNDGDTDGAGELCDCNDTDSDVFPGAPEINDGLDNQCSGDVGFGLVDEISGETGFHDPNDDSKYSWTPQAGATMYEVARASEPDFSGGCLILATSMSFIVDPDTPSTGGLFHYLVRASSPLAGSWGAGSAGERVIGCP